jgi:porin
MMRTAAVFVAVAAIVLIGSAVWAEETQPTAETKAAAPAAAEPKNLNLDWREFSKTTPPPKQYIGGDLWTRDTLTGDWGGLRNDLASKGLTIDFGITQTLQGNLGGGKTYRWPYQGSEDLIINIDTGKMGLWPGGFLKIHAENRWGNAANPDTGALLPVNTDSLYPVPGADTTTLSEVTFAQFLSPQVGVIMGKMQPRENNVFAHDENSQFMNLAFVFNPAVATTVPQDFLAAGVVALPTDWLTITTLVLDSEGTANVSGFDPDTAFHRGTTVFNNWEFTVKPFGQVGHQRIGWTWSDKSRAQLDQNMRLLVREAILSKLGLGPRPVLQRSTNDWSVLYDFDQYVYTVKDHPDRGFGFFGRFGFTSGEVNPVQDFYSIGVGGKGLCSARPNDSFGVGYYYLCLSDQLPRIIQRRVHDEEGVELYYNIAVTPWLHVTPDIQVIDPVSKSVGITTVFGIRVQMSF